MIQTDGVGHLGQLDGSETDGRSTGRLEVQLLSGPDGCLARFVGDLVGETAGVISGCRGDPSK